MKNEFTWMDRIDRQDKADFNFLFLILFILSIHVNYSPC
jgi:hypothetical protein